MTALERLTHAIVGLTLLCAWAGMMALGRRKWR